MRFNSSVAISVMIGFLSSQPAFCTEIKVFSLPGLSSVMDILEPRFNRETGDHALMQYGTLAEVKVAIASDAFDVIIYTSPFIIDLVKQEKLLAGAPIVISRVKIGVGMRSGSTRPDIGNVGAFKQTMLNATSISYTRDSPAGIYLTTLMQKLGIADAMAAKTKLLGGGGQNPRAVAAGEVQYGLSIIPDMVGVAGVDVVGPLPDDLNPPAFDFAAGINASSHAMTSAKRLLSFLKSPAQAAVFVASGMEPVISQ